MVPDCQVFELPFSAFQRAAPLLRQAWFDEAFIEMVLEGIQPGRIFVDQPENPGAALLCHPYEFYVAGDAAPANPLRRFIQDHPLEPDVFHTLYGYCAVGEAWEQALVVDSGGLLQAIPRRNFKFWRSAPLVAETACLPPEALVPIDAHLAELLDRDFHQRITRDWGSLAEFLKHSYGFCLLVEGQIASVVDVAGISSRFANLGVETAEPYRRRGYAARVCAAGIADTLRRGLLPTWDCDGPNLASGQLALKLGFTEEQPFSQLSLQPGSQLSLSQGRWNQTGLQAGIVVWTRTAV